MFRAAARIAENDDWPAIDAAIHAGAGAFAFASGSKDAALVASLAPGAYTVKLGPAASATAQTGVGLVEVFELAPAASATTATRLINLSTRAFVGTGQNILIPGIVVGPRAIAPVPTSRLVLIRAVGPGLADFGVTGPLARPQLKVIASTGEIAADNIGWQSAANREALIAASARVGAFPLSLTRADSALLLSLNVADFTIQVSGADGGSGIALVEVYEVP